MDKVMVKDTLYNIPRLWALWIKYLTIIWIWEAKWLDSDKHDSFFKTVFLASTLENVVSVIWGS